jgi:hypothetical protein
MGREWDEMQGAARREVEEARLRFTQAADRAGREAMSAGRTISALVYDELDRRGSDLSDGLQHIAEKMRDMSAAGDGDPPRMVRQAVDMIDDLSQRLRDRTARDMVRPRKPDDLPDGLRCRGRAGGKGPDCPKQGERRNGTPRRDG